MIPTISELELYLHEQMRASPEAERSLLTVEVWIAQRKKAIAWRYPGRNVGSLPFFTLFEEGADA